MFRSERTFHVVLQRLISTYRALTRLPVIVALLDFQRMPYRPWASDCHAQQPRRLPSRPATRSHLCCAFARSTEARPSRTPHTTRAARSHGYDSMVIEPHCLIELLIQQLLHSLDHGNVCVVVPRGSACTADLCNTQACQITEEESDRVLRSSVGECLYIAVREVVWHGCTNLQPRID